MPTKTVLPQETKWVPHWSHHYASVLYVCNPEYFRLLYIGIQYYGNASSRDIHKVHRIIRQAQKLTQCQCQSMQEIYNIVCTRKVRLIVGDEAHPLHQFYSKLRSGIRFKSMRGRTKRYLTSFVPASITHFNSLCRRCVVGFWNTIHADRY